MTQLPQWNHYFDSQVDIKIQNDIFKTYQICCPDPKVLFVFCHGAGYTGLTFATVSKQLKELIPEAAILAFDCRGHGLSSNEKEYELSLTQLSEDLVSIVNSSFPTLPKEVVLIGHSMGGSVVIDVASKKRIPNVLGVAVLDIVEGTAIESLPFMQQIIRSRPSSFKSIETAISWQLRQVTVKNKESVRVSMPSQLVLETDSLGKECYVWRTDLSKTDQFWTGWFTGMSEKFLTIPCGRLLILAGTERLDKCLTIGQMQGKFQMLIYPDSGHLIQVYFIIYI